MLDKGNSIKRDIYKAYHIKMTIYNDLESLMGSAEQCLFQKVMAATLRLGKSVTFVGAKIEKISASNFYPET